ncbi:hypothetical protein [Mycoplasma sp. P36-A1]|uniref:hypothetical protein n=1 Tax=Mycoplasma sp. P36-A1 TaxID=3252900 RepID=UPI003C30BCCE
MKFKHLIPLLILFLLVTCFTNFKKSEYIYNNNDSQLKIRILNYLDTFNNNKSKEYNNIDLDLKWYYQLMNN